MNKGWIFITGTSTGIGFDLARSLSTEGFKVLAGVRNQKDFEKLQILGQNIQPIYVDVTNPQQIRDAAVWLETNTSETLPLVAVINNAGMVSAGPIEILSLDEFRKQFEVNVWGGLSVIKEMLPLMRRFKSKLINMGSLTGFIPVPFLGAYSMSKHALHAMSVVLNIELADFGIQVTCLEPGSVQSAIWDKSGESAINVLNKSAAHHQIAYAGFRNVVGSTLSRQKRMAIHPERISNFILGLLKKKKLRPFYRVGVQSRALAFLDWLLPMTWLQKVLQKSLSDS